MILKQLLIQLFFLELLSFWAVMLTHNLYFLVSSMLSHFYGFHHKDESFVDNFLVSFLCARFVMVFRDLSYSSELVVASICVSHEPSFIY